MILSSDTDSYQVISDYLKEEFELEPDEISEMFEEYMDNVNSFLDTCNKNLEDSQFDQIAKDSHCVKGSSINISAKLMAILARKLELAAKDNDADKCREITAKMQVDFNALQDSLNN